MKQTILFSRYKFATLVYAFIILVVFTSCDDDDDAMSDINRVSMKTLPQVNYILDNALNLSDMVITIDKNGTSSDIPFSSFEEEGITTEPENGKIVEFSDKYITVKIGDTGKGLIQPIVVTNDVINVEIKNETETEYVRGQKLNLDDLIVTLSYQNGDVKDVAHADFADEITTTPISGEPLLDPNTNVDLTITHAVSSLDAKQTLILEPFFPLSSSLVTGPTKNTYAVGDLLDLSGTVIKYTLFSGTVLDVASEDFADFGIASNPADGGILAATNTTVPIRHFLFGAQVNVNLTID